MDQFWDDNSCVLLGLRVRGQAADAGGCALGLTQIALGNNKPERKNCEENQKVTHTFSLGEADLGNLPSGRFLKHKMGRGRRVRV